MMGKPGIVKKLIFNILMFVFFVLAACQPTPEVEVVVRKDALEQSVASMPQQEERFSAPEAWKDELESTTGNKVTIYAEVICPPFSSLSVRSVRPENFTQEEVDAFIKYFVGDAALYNGEYQEIKSDIEEDIVETQQLLAMTQEQRDAKFGGTPEDELKQRLQDLKARYADAPESAAKETVTTELKKDKDGFEVLEVYAGDGGGDDALIEVYNLVGESSNSASFTIRLRDASAGGKISSLSGEPEEIAQAVFEGLGITDTQLREKGEAAASNDPDNRKTVTRLRYERCMDGLPMREVCSLISEDERDYAPAVWRPDTLYVDVGENGLTDFSWREHGEIMGVEKDNVALLPFEDVMSKFGEYIFLQPVWGESEKTDNDINIVITGIDLCMVAIPRKDAGREYLLAPAWNFYGYMEYPGLSDAEQGIPEGMRPQKGRECFLTLSAADGAMLHR